MASSLLIVVHEVQLALDEISDWASRVPGYSEVWIEHIDGSRLCVLLSPGFGFLMYLRDDCDAGFSTRKAEWDDPDEEVEFELSNGQVDRYPKRLAQSRATALDAARHFIETRSLLATISWHNDSLT
ncbi:MAG: Imm1 family immunity protein [Myxococcota bacterium]